MNDDSPYLEKALQEYRERTWDDSAFVDLSLEVQRLVLARAQELEAKCWDREKVAAA